MLKIRRKRDNPVKYDLGARKQRNESIVEKLALDKRVIFSLQN